MLDLFSTQQKKTLRSMILDILSNEWPLTSKKIYNRLKKKYNIQVTYQAVFKTIKELQSTGVLDADGNKSYSLNINWIKQVFEFSNKLKTRYEHGIIFSPERLLNGEITTVTFENLFHFYDSVMDLFFELSFYDKNMYVYFYHMWWAISFEGERFLKFKRFADKFDSFVICKNDTYGDRINGEFYNTFKTISMSKYNVDFDSNCDLIVVGDFVCQVFFEERLKKTLDKLYVILENEDPKNIGKLFETLFFKKTKIVLLVNKNRDLAQKIRTEIYKYFVRKKYDKENFKKFFNRPHPKKKEFTKSRVA